MVHGLEKFKEYFKDCTDQYVFIGGTACDILLNELGVEFRGTKDLDVVLIVEALDATFGKNFWRFVQDGGYEHRGKNEGEHQYYRFSNPSNASFPKMIELFSRKPDFIKLSYDTGLTPIHIDDSISGLSAILLSDVYYNLITKGKSLIDGFSVLELETIILFKIKAWLDMKERLASGQVVDSRDLRKHKNDVFRLLENVLPSKRVNLPTEIQNDVSDFLRLIVDDKPILKDLGIKGTNVNEMLQMLRVVFGLN